MLSKTGELVAWGRVHGVSVDILERLWRTHVEVSVMFGTALFLWPNSGEMMLDRAQRKGGRLLLGFAARCPSPVVNMELGWVVWSAMGVLAKVRMLKRLLNNNNAVVQAVVGGSAAHHGGWVARTAELVKSWEGGAVPKDAGEWAIF